MKDLKFAVLGAGHGGKALAAHLAIKGFSVNLYNRSTLTASLEWKKFFSSRTMESYNMVRGQICKFTRSFIFGGFGHQRVLLNIQFKFF